MRLDLLKEKLRAKRSFLNNIYFAYINPTEDLEINGFQCEDDLDRFANSKMENQEQIILKKVKDKKCFFISLRNYDAILIENGDDLCLRSFWAKEESQKIQDIKPDLAKAKEEVLRFFSTEEKKKCAS